MRVPSAAAMRALGAQLAEVLRAGDLVLLLGDLGAGKTTLAQGIGAGLGVPQPVTSPTFVLARVHRGGRLPLVHVDAYRLAGPAELDDLDLDTDLPGAVTVVEWGAGLAEVLAPDRLEVHIELDSELDGGVDRIHPAGEEPAGRDVTLVAHGDRWRGVPLPS